MGPLPLLTQAQIQGAGMEVRADGTSSGANTECWHHRQRLNHLCHDMAWTTDSYQCPLTIVIYCLLIL